MISLCGASGCGALRLPPVSLRTSRFPASRCSDRSTPPSSHRLLFAAGCVFWIILLVAVGKTLRSEDSLCRMGVEGTSSGNTEGQEACASSW